MIPRAYCSPDPEGPQYEQYCKQKLMVHQLFRQIEDLLGDFDTFTAACAHLCQSCNVPNLLLKTFNSLK